MKNIAPASMQPFTIYFYFPTTERTVLYGDYASIRQNLWPQRLASSPTLALSLRLCISNKITLVHFFDGNMIGIASITHRRISCFLEKCTKKMNIYPKLVQIPR